LECGQPQTHKFNRMAENHEGLSIISTSKKQRKLFGVNHRILFSMENKVIRLLSLWTGFSTKVKAVIRFTFVFLLFSNVTNGIAQQYTSSSIFAHNDYAKPVPLQTAYQHQVGFIEADVFLRGDELLVAHTRFQIDKTKTLDKLYLEPLSILVSVDQGFIYPDQEKSLTLIIDLKTDGVETLNLLVTKLKKYPQLLLCKTFRVAVSGNVPDPALWKNFPDFIYYDGRPGITYTSDQLKRIRLISDSFKNYSGWNGNGVLESEDRKKIMEVIKSVHAKGKPIRFWANPNSGNAWAKLMELEVDVLNTDDVAGLSSFIKSLPKK
jgi:alkaline phosphatase